MSDADRLAAATERALERYPVRQGDTPAETRMRDGQRDAYRDSLLRAWADPTRDRELRDLVERMARDSGGHVHARDMSDPTDDGQTREIVETFIRASDLVAERDEATEYVVEELLPVAGLSIMVSRPKVGKSTLLRHGAVAVAAGRSFLGRRVRQGPVLLLALEDRRAIVRAQLRALRVGDAPLHVHVGPVLSTDPAGWLRDAIVRHGAVLACIDPLARFMRSKNLNDYSELTALTEPLLSVAHETGCHVAFAHHAPKGGREKGEQAADAIDTPLGSTQLAGFVDTVVILRRRAGNLRTIETVQRTGEDLAETVLALDPATAEVALAGTVEAATLSRVRTIIIAAVVGAESTLTEAEIRERVGGDRTQTAKALRGLVADGTFAREGKGRKNSSFKYFSLSSCEDPSKQEKRVSENGGLDSRCSYVESSENQTASQLLQASIQSVDLSQRESDRRSPNGPDSDREVLS